MKCLTEAEWQDLMLKPYVGFTSIEDVAAACAVLLKEAARLGVVITIEQRPLQPLAMGHYKTVASVREARKRA